MLVFFFFTYVVIKVGIVRIESQSYSEERILVSFLNIEKHLVLHLCWIQGEMLNSVSSTKQ